MAFSSAPLGQPCGCSWHIYPSAHLYCLQEQEHVFLTCQLELWDVTANSDFWLSIKLERAISLFYKRLLLNQMSGRIQPQVSSPFEKACSDRSRAANSAHTAGKEPGQLRPAALFFFLIALPGLQMLQKNTTKQCSQEVKSFSSAMRGCVFFYAADCLEVRNCSLTGCIFLTAWAGTGGTDRPLCQMKTETWDGRVGRQWFNDTAGGWFPSASLTFLAAVLQRPLLMALRKQNAGRILCNSYCCHYYELCSLPETFTHKLWIEFLFGIYFCIYILT